MSIKITDDKRHDQTVEVFEKKDGEFVNKKEEKIENKPVEIVKEKPVVNNI